MIDTHCHLTDGAFSEDLQSVLQRATEAGVEKIVCVSECASDGNVVLSLHAEHPSLVAPSVGLHPEHICKLDREKMHSEVVEIEALASANASSLVAIGEVGLDFSPHVLARAVSSNSVSTADEVKENQRAAFAKQIDLARRLDLPVSVHSRAAGRHALAVIQQYPDARACMHAFDGRAVYAERMINAHSNTYFSVPPCIVRSDNLAKMVQRLPLSRLLLESDAPALGATAGARNEPSEIVKSLSMVAGLKGVSMEYANTVMDENARALFTRI